MSFGQTPEWFPVEECLPEGNGDVLVVYRHSQGVSIADQSVVRVVAREAARERVNCVFSHWMPLPRPPSKTEQSNGAG